MKPYVPARFTTPRWGKQRSDRDSAEKRFGDQLKSLLEKKEDSEPLPKELAPTFARMRSRANLIGGTKKPESITEEQWHASCSFHDVPDLHLEFRKEPGASVTLADIADEVVALRAFRAA